MWWSKPAIFSNFGRHIFGIFGVEANIVMRRHEVLYWLSVVLKCLTLNDLEIPFYAKMCFYRRFDDIICLAFGDNYLKTKISHTVSNVRRGL